MFEYKSPQQPVVDRPRCWGQESFCDPNSRECRACPARQSCQDQIVRIKNAQGFQQGQFQQQPMQPPVQQQPVFQQQMNPQQVQPQVMRAFAPSPVAPIYPQQMAQRPMSPHQAPAGYGFGWMPDPLYYTMASSPRPLRPQFAGEGFAKAVVINMGLAAAESLSMQLFLAIRQLVFAPKPQMQQLYDQNQGPGQPG